MSIKALQDFTYFSRYARYNVEAKRRETWEEAVDRVKEMHLRKYGHLGHEIIHEIEWSFDQVKSKRVLGSQRALQFGGKPIEQKNSRIYNCTVSFCDRPRFFQECFWLLLCGCGCGFSVQNHHIEKLPEFYKEIKTKGKKTFLIPDTIEGWADALGILISTYIPHEEFSEWYGYEVDFDFGAIRPIGSLLSSGAGKAPGPNPLRRSLKIIKGLLDTCVKSEYGRLRPIDAYDIIMHASDAVLSGGIRRSATICIFSIEDKEMIKAKTGNWHVENPQRARSNNSALLLRDNTSKEQFSCLIDSVKEYGEPGFYWSDSTEQVPNPCVEVGFWPVDVDSGLSGWQKCNLCEINGRKCKTKEDFAIAARAAAIIGTLQAGYTSFSYLGETTEKIVRREALLGVSITGMMDNPEIIFDSEIQREMAELVVKTNQWFAKLLGINAAARCTCVKPAGTTSCILGSSSGIHPHHAKRYLRRVQANILEAPLQHFKKFNPFAVESSVWSANKTDEVISFCIEVPDGAKTRNDISAIELLKLVKNTQKNWVAYGKTLELCVQPWLTNNVSNTINVGPDEWNEVVDFIYNNRQWFAGISLLPQSGDLDYPQAPFTNISSPGEIFHKYGNGALMASGLIVDGLRVYDNNLWAACDAAINKKNLEKSNEKQDWIRRVWQFAGRYCDGDVKRCTYLLKEVNNWKLWLDLNREYQDVDYTTLFESQDETKVMDTIACAGGKCDLIY